uniref:Methyltransferase-like protein 13 n=1 Tax=Oryza rufipogon TaxID=4529 RepID=A0A0E0QLB6_ORYRU
MAVSSELEGLQDVEPSRFIAFSFPNPLLLLDHASDPYAHGGHEFLRVAVLDHSSPHPSPRTAAMLVPAGRHRDWIFSTRAGHLHLLLASRSQCSHLSRLILVGPELSAPSPSRVVVVAAAARPDPDPAHARLLPLLLALCPRAAFGGDAIPDVPLLSFHDDLLRLAPVKVVAGPVVGEMVVEDVAVDCAPRPAELRRRLRFKRMPFLVQTQVRLVRQLSPGDSLMLDALDEVGGGSLQPEVGGELVQPYLQAMAAGLAVIAPSMDESFRLGGKPRCLCAGIGGGALLMSIRMGLQCDVLGIEADGVVLDVARSHFGLVEDEFLQVRVGDAIQMIQDFAHQGDPDMNFSAIMVDLDSSDAICGVSAPPLEMTKESILLASRTILHHDGAFILNVIPPAADGSFYKGLIDVLRHVFSELYEINVSNGENFVLVATVSPVETILADSSGSVLTKLRKLAGDFLEHITRI